MPTYFRRYAPDQDLLLPSSLGEWLPEGHLAYFISAVIDELDVHAFYSRYEGDGRRNAPYEPRMMLKVLVYAYANGVFSSRQIAKKLEEDVAFRVLAADNFPSHRTLCEFRRRHLEEFRALFVQVLHIARESGLLSLGKLAIDGTKVKSNASKHKAMSYARMAEAEQRLVEEIDEILELARQRDESEEQRYGRARGDELPEELHRRETRLANIRGAKARLEQAQREADQARGRHADDERKPPGKGRPYKRDFGVPEDKAQSNFTDPDSRIMKTGDGYQQCYNAQLAVDSEFQLIVDTEVTNQANDSGALQPLVERIERTHAHRPQVVLADAGYRDESCFAALEALDIDAYISVGREGIKSRPIDADTHPATQRMRDKLTAPEGKECYAMRKAIVEPVNGWIKHVLGFRQFSVRGHQAVRGEWDLVSLALNLRRMHPLLTMT